MFDTTAPDAEQKRQSARQSPRDTPSGPFSEPSRRLWLAETPLFAVQVTSRPPPPGRLSVLVSERTETAHVLVGRLRL
jgi:hypothetical protein